MGTLYRTYFRQRVLPRRAKNNQPYVCWNQCITPIPASGPNWPGHLNQGDRFKDATKRGQKH